MPRALILGLALWLLTFPLVTTAQDGPTFTYTYHQPTGNRVVAGQGTFPDVQVIDYQIGNDNIAMFISGIFLPDSDNVLWQFRTVQENLAAVEVGIEDTTAKTSIYPGVVDEESLLVLGQYQDGTMFMVSSPIDGSLLTHPTFTGVKRLAITTSNEIVLDALWSSERFDTLPLDALPDARIVVNEAGQIAVYAGATDQRYAHGVLGDALEASALVVLAIEDDQLVVTSRIDLPDGDVFEGLSPFWADIDGDGADDLVTTVSNAASGAQIRVYRADGSLLASGPAVGQGYRWRHQLAFGPYGPAGEHELVDVLTPHIGGVVEFYRHDGYQLEVVASLPGYTSHVIGTRNLDMAVAGDFNGDGQPEIVLPTQDRQFIAGLQRTTEGVQEVWRLPLDGTLSSNLSAVTLPDESLALAAGTDDGRLRIWLPT